jgi:hypothetical protein
MAVTINRVIADGSQTATIELVSTGTLGGEGGTVIDLSTLSGGAGSGTERARVTRAQVIVSGEEMGVSLIWGGAGVVFLTMPPGSYDIRIPCDPVNGVNTLIGYSCVGNSPFTLRLYLEKLTGFPGSMAKINTIL